MFLPSHLAGGCIAVYLVDKTFRLPGKKAKAVTAGILTGSVFPDIDALFFSSIKDHHDSWLHTPLFYIFLALTLFVYSRWRGRGGWFLFPFGFIAGAMVHLLSDLVT